MPFDINFIFNGLSLISFEQTSSFMKVYKKHHIYLLKRDMIIKRKEVRLPCNKNDRVCYSFSFYILA